MVFQVDAGYRDGNQAQYSSVLYEETLISRAWLLAAIHPMLKALLLKEPPCLHNKQAVHVSHNKLLFFCACFFFNLSIPVFQH